MFHIHEGKLLKYTADVDTVFIPEGVTTIDDDAFTGCHFATVVFPSTLTHIGARAFERCGITTLELPPHVTIGDAAFRLCTHLESVSLPEGLKRIPNRAFEYCTRLAEIDIPDTLEEIGDDAFVGCDLTCVDVPCNVIGDRAFRNCLHLTRIFLNCTHIGADAFRGCIHLDTLEIPPHTQVGARAFQSGWRLLH